MSKIELINNDTLFITTAKGTWAIENKDIRAIREVSSTRGLYPAHSLPVWLKDGSIVHIAYDKETEATDGFKLIVAQWLNWLSHVDVYENSSQHPVTRPLVNGNLELTWGANSIQLELDKYVSSRIEHQLLRIRYNDGRELRLTGTQPEYFIPVTDAINFALRGKK